MKLLARASALLTTVLVAALLTLVPVAPAHAAVNVFPLPTSNSSPGRIVTAPNGDMWFTEEDVNQIGRITTQGVITEYDLGVQTVEDTSVNSIDVADDGTVWVVYDSGWTAMRFDPSNPAGRTVYDLGGSPYGGEVRVAPGGVAWITMNFDESGVAVFDPAQPDGTWPANAPECEDTLGEAADGTMWCAAGIGDKLVHIGPGANGGVTYPLPSDATYANGLTAGPIGSIWFTRSSSGSWLTSPRDGSVGYLDAANGATTIWKTGDRTAPRDLIKAPDGTMWFTNGGAAPAIGHINAAGRGEITAVGNYSPESLTWGADNAIWFTDAANNSIVRVTTDQLQTTNIQVGSGATMVTSATPPPPPTPAPPTPAPPTPPAPGTKGLPTGAIAKPSGVVRVKKLKIPIAISCPASAAQGCNGSLRVSVGKTAITKSTSYRIGSTGSAVVRIKVNKVGKRLLKPRKKVKVVAALTPVGAKKPTSSLTFKVLRK